MQKLTIVISRGITVGALSGGQLAMTLVATFSIITVIIITPPRVSNSLFSEGGTQGGGFGQVGGGMPRETS